METAYFDSGQQWYGYNATPDVAKARGMDRDEDGNIPWMDVDACMCVRARVYLCGGWVCTICGVGCPPNFSSWLVSLHSWMAGNRALESLGNATNAESRQHGRRRYLDGDSIPARRVSQLSERPSSSSHSIFQSRRCALVVRQTSRKGMDDIHTLLPCTYGPIIVLYGVLVWTQRQAAGV